MLNRTRKHLAPRRNRRRLSLERMESRQLLSATALLGLAVTADGLASPIATLEADDAAATALEWLAEPALTVAIVGEGEGSPASPSSPVGSEVPTAPTNLAATVVSPSEVNLTWDLADASETGIVIERKMGAEGSFQTLVALPAGENTFTDTSCWAATDYTYRVQAVNATGASSYSQETSAVTDPVPAGALAVVTDLQVVPSSPNAAALSFTDPNPADLKRQYLLERSEDGVAYRVVEVLGTSTTWTDVGLSPGATYSYRVRGISWNNPTSDYSAAAQITMPDRLPGAPIEPSRLEAETTATTATLTWTNNDATESAFKIERAVFSPWHPQPWTTVAITAPGATSFTDTGLRAEATYVYRVSATNEVADSGYAVPASDVLQSLFGDQIAVITASAGTGSPQVYDIGPGHAYEDIADLDWSQLGPGDTVNIHYKPGGYHELFQISTRGTADNWITINGVPDPATGQLPIIDGLEAVLDPQFKSSYAPLHGSGAIVVGTRPGYVSGYRPGYITIQNLQVQRAYAGNDPNTFTDYDGALKAYTTVGAGIYLYRADHITIRDCIITDNGEGIFGAGQASFDRLMTDITVSSNEIYNNGNLGTNRTHNTYLEAIDTVYEYNHYGPLRAGAGGNGLKDRSVGVVVRGNYIEGGAHELQLPASENQVNLALTIPRYHRAMVYGNVIVDGPGNVSGPVEYGGETHTALGRKGVLYLYHNTIVVQSDKSAVWRVNAVGLNSTSETLDARNNIFAALPATPGAVNSDFGLLGVDSYVSRKANAYVGRNWVPPDYLLNSYGNAGFKGHVAGLDNLMVGQSDDPGFVAVLAGDYELAADSVAVDAATRLAGASFAFPVDHQFSAEQHAIPRAVLGAAADLGAWEYGSGNQAPTAILLSSTVVAELNPGATIGTVTVIDPNVADTHLLSVSDSRFEIIDNELRLKPDASLNQATEPSITLDITATDSGGLSRIETFVITVGRPIVIDDGDAGYAEIGPGWYNIAWWNKGYQVDSRFVKAGTGQSMAVWQQSVLPGRYTVQATWFGYHNNVSNVPYRIYDGDTLLAEVAVDQKRTPTFSVGDPAAFFTLATVDVASSTLRVVLGNDATGGTLVVADAVRIVPGTITSPPATVQGPTLTDDGDAGYRESAYGWYSISWWNKGYQVDSRFANAGDGRSTATWQQTLAPGRYAIQATWFGYHNNVSDAPYRIYDGETLLAEVRVNQKQTPTLTPGDPAPFMTLATVDITSGNVRVVLGNDATGGYLVVADAVRILPDATASTPLLLAAASVPEANSTLAGESAAEPAPSDRARAIDIADAALDLGWFFDPETWDDGPGNDRSREAHPPVKLAHLRALFAEWGETPDGLDDLLHRLTGWEPDEAWWTATKRKDR